MTLSAIQTPILIIGSFLVLFLGLSALGDGNIATGWTEMMDHARSAMNVGADGHAYGANHMFHWTEADPMYQDYPGFWVFIGASIIGFWYWCTDQHIVQRVLGQRKGEDNDVVMKRARRGTIAAGYFKILPVFMFLIPGMVAVEGELNISRWGTNLRAGVENIKNYTYFNQSALPEQNGGNIQVLSATLKQDFRLGVFHLDNEVTWQKTSNETVLPLPQLSLYHNFYIWTHDAFRVGEDGPTHEPVEQEAQIRLMEKLKNHKGHNSMLVLRPADAEETTVAWKLAMENTSTPTALIFSRQNIANLPAGNDYSQAAKGAYIVAGSDENPDVILVASGSEVSTLEAGAELLRKDGIKIRIVSAPSEGLFRSQSKEYQNSIIPTGAKVFGLTAGLPVNLEGLVGANGKVFGLESFGFSAPYKVLDEKLGFTAQNVYNQVKEMLA